jgi:hypothetical protein
MLVSATYLAFPTLQHLKFLNLIAQPTTANFSITITILDIIHRCVFYLKLDASETAYSLRLQVEPTQMGLIERGNLRVRNVVF